MASFRLKRLICWLFGHRPSDEARLVGHILHRACLRCGADRAVVCWLLSTGDLTGGSEHRWGLGQ